LTAQQNTYSSFVTVSDDVHCGQNILDWW